MKKVKIDEKKGWKNDVFKYIRLKIKEKRKERKFDFKLGELWGGRG